MKLQQVILLASVAGMAACSQPASTDTAPPAAAEVAAADAAVAIDSTTTDSKTTDSADLPLAFIAFGTEPFWSVRVDGDRLHWSSPENMDGIDFTAQAEVLPLQRRYNGQLQGQAVSLTLSAGPCSDGMSDQVHPWRVSWQVDGQQLAGCARLAD